MLIDTRTSHLQLVRTANSTQAGTSVAQPADTQTQPAGTGVVEVGHLNSATANGLFLRPFGTDTAAETFLMAVFGWDFIPGDQANVVGTWTATLLAGFTCTLSTSAKGLAGSAVNASQFYCDTVALITNQGTANVSNEIVSPTTNKAAHVLVDLKGCRFAEVLFWMNGSAVSANALYRRL